MLPWATTNVLNCGESPFSSLNNPFSSIAKWWGGSLCSRGEEQAYKLEQGFIDTSL